MSPVLTDREEKLKKIALELINRQIKVKAKRRRRKREPIETWSQESRNVYIKRLYNTDYDQKHGITLTYNVAFEKDEPRRAFKNVCQYIKKEFNQVYGYWVLQPRNINGHPHFHMTILVKEPSDAFSIKKLGKAVKTLWRHELNIGKYKKAKNISVDENVETDYIDYTTKNGEKRYDKSRLEHHIIRFWLRGRRWGYINRGLTKSHEHEYECYCVDRDLFDEFKAYAASLTRDKINECHDKKIQPKRLEDYLQRIESGDDLFMAYLTDEQVNNFRMIASKGHKVILDD